MAKKKKKVDTPLKATDFYSLVFSEDPRLHPEKPLTAYVKMTPEFEGKKYTRVIHLINSETGDDQQISAGGSGSDFMPRWSPAGDTLGFISTRSQKPQVALLPESWGEAKTVTSAKNGVMMFEWSPDGKALLYLSRVREEERKEEDKPSKKKKKMDPREAKRLEEDRKYAEEMRIDPRVYFRTVVKQGTAMRDDRNNHIYIQPVDGGKVRRLTDGNADYGPCCWSPDGKTIYSSCTARATDSDVDIKSDIVSIDVKTGEMTYLTDNDNGEFYPRVSPDGQWIYYMAFQDNCRYQQKMRLMRLPVAGGEPEDILGTDFDLDPGMFSFDESGKYIYFSVSFRGRESIARLPVAGGNLGDMEYVIRDDGMAKGWHLRGDELVYGYECPEFPDEIFIKKIAQGKLKKSPDGLPLVSGQEKALTSHNEPFMKKRVLSLPKEVKIERPDGFEIQGWYMLPHGYKKGKKYPWVVQVHGGPHVMWGWSFWHEFQAMCAEGYGVYFSNPRGSDGYGHEFKGAIHKEWGEKDSLDILAGSDLMVEMGLADSNKLYLTGGSFGGFMTGWIVTHDNRFKGAVAQRGVYNFISMYGASDALTLVEWEFDTLPWKDTELLWDRSPLKYVENVTTPVMVLHSELDYRVGISQAEEFYTALKRCGKKACFVRYPREGHELSRSGEPRHRVDRIQKIIGWFDDNK